jgi:hypothetical protein
MTTTVDGIIGIITTGNVTANWFFGNIDGNNIQGNINVSGDIATTANVLADKVFASAITGATITGPLTTAAQPNITSVGTLTSLAVAGGITSTSLTSSGAIIGSTLTGSLTTAAQPSITSVGTLTSLAVAGGITSASLTSTGAITGATLTGSLTTAAQPNITSVGTLTSLAVTGGITSASLTSTGAITGATLTGPLTTAAQPNITSVGTLTSLAVTGNITAGNITTGNITLGPGAVLTGSGAGLTSLNASNITTGTLSSARLSGTYTIDINGSATTAGTVTTAAQPNITSVGTLSSLNVSGPLTTTQLTTGSAGTAGSITGQWTLSPGSTMNATYADMAERYTSDKKYEVGTVLMIGGPAETTIATESSKTCIAGIVSSEPAYILNSTLKDSVVLALIGRVPCKVVGTIAKGDLLTVSHIDGVATSTTTPQCGTIIGRALESYDSSDVGIIEVKVDRG